jgi:leader peptidase (prepilin peptidase)/N-methyltransferase
MLFVVTILIVIFFTDIKYGIIPFMIVVPACVIILAYTALFTPSVLLSSILSAIGLFLFFFLLYRYTHGRGMGFGDVMYVCLMGLLLGFPRSILGLYIAFLTGAIVAVLLISLKKKQFAGGTIPFGPFLVLGTFIGLFWGDFLVEKVIQLLFPL